MVRHLNYLNDTHSFFLAVTSDNFPQTCICTLQNWIQVEVAVLIQRLSIYSDPRGQDNDRDSTVSDEIQQFASRNPPSASITVLKCEFPGVNRRTPIHPGDKL